jgi:tetratricopeptide (TPR) repeat protein
MPTGQHHSWFLLLSALTVLVLLSISCQSNYEKGLRARSNGNLAKALQYLNKVNEKSKDLDKAREIMDSIHIGLARLALRNCEFDIAREHTGKISQNHAIAKEILNDTINIIDYERLASIGDSLSQKGDFNRALENYETANKLSLVYISSIIDIRPLKYVGHISFQGGMSTNALKSVISGLISCKKMEEADLLCWQVLNSFPNDGWTDSTKKTISHISEEGQNNSLSKVSRQQNESATTPEPVDYTDIADIKLDGEKAIGKTARLQITRIQINKSGDANSGEQRLYFNGVYCGKSRNTDLRHGLIMVYYARDQISDVSAWSISQCKAAKVIILFVMGKEIAVSLEKVY